MIGKKSPCKFALIGQNISSSLSPFIHGWWYRQYGLDCSYELIETSQENLHEIFNKLLAENFIGVNITTPLKSLVSGYVKHVEYNAQKFNTINCINFTNSTGYTSDGYGFIKSIEHIHQGLEKLKLVAIIGAGGAARSILAALEEKSIKAEIYNRSDSLILKNLGFNVLNINELNQEKYNIIINTTGQNIMALSNSYEKVFDINYRVKTDKRLFYKDSGKLMLLFQAAKSFEIWFGFYPEISNELINQLCLK